jgi:hypothetical protein
VTISVIDTGFITDSLKDSKTINQEQKYTICYSCRRFPSDISIIEKLYVPNRGHNIAHILNVAVSNE